MCHVLRHKIYVRSAVAHVLVFVKSKLSIKFICLKKHGVVICIYMRQKKVNYRVQEKYIIMFC